MICNDLQYSDGLDRPDYTPGNLAVNTDPRGAIDALNTSLFAMPSMGNLGTAARRFFYGPGMANFDIALQKSLQFTESRALNLRFEAFDVLNHAQFFGAASVNGNIGSPGFGQFVRATTPRVVQLAVKYMF